LGLNTEFVGTPVGVSSVNDLSNTITLATPTRLNEGDRLEYKGTGTPISGLHFGQIYYVIKVGSSQSVYKLAESLSLARDQIAIDISGTANGNFTPIQNVANEGFTVPFITLAPIHAQAGTINVVGRYFVGSGDLNAPGEVSVRIVNDSPAHLRITSIPVPQGEHGHLLFKQTIVSTHAQINAL